MNLYNERHDFKIDTSESVSSLQSLFIPETSAGLERAVFPSWCD